MRVIWQSDLVRFPVREKDARLTKIEQFFLQAKKKQNHLIAIAFMLYLQTHVSIYVISFGLA